MMVIKKLLTRAIGMKKFKVHMLDVYWELIS